MSSPREAHDLAHDLRRQRAGDVAAEIDVAPLAGRVEDGDAARADLFLHRGRSPAAPKCGASGWRYAVCCGASMISSMWRDHLELFGRGVLDHDAAEPRRERLGMARTSTASA